MPKTDHSTVVRTLGSFDVRQRLDGYVSVNDLQAIDPDLRWERFLPAHKDAIVAIVAELGVDSVMNLISHSASDGDFIHHRLAIEFGKSHHINMGEEIASWDFDEVSIEDERIATEEAIGGDPLSVDEDIKLLTAATMVQNFYGRATALKYLNDRGFSLASAAQPINNPNKDRELILRKLEECGDWIGKTALTKKTQTVRASVRQEILDDLVEKNIIQCKKRGAYYEYRATPKISLTP